MSQLKTGVLTTLVILANLSLNACNNTKISPQTPSDPHKAGDFSLLSATDQKPLTSIDLQTGVSTSQTNTHLTLGSSNQATAGVAAYTVDIKYKKTESTPRLTKDKQLPAYLQVQAGNTCHASDEQHLCTEFTISYTPTDITKNDFIGNITFSNSSGQKTLAITARVPSLQIQIEADNAPALYPSSAGSTPAHGSVVYTDDPTHFKIHINTLNHLQYKPTIGNNSLVLKTADGAAQQTLYPISHNICGTDTLNNIPSYGCDAEFNLRSLHGVNDIPTHYGLNHALTLVFANNDKSSMTQNFAVTPLVTHTFFVGSSVDGGDVFDFTGTGAINQNHASQTNLWGSIVQTSPQADNIKNIHNFDVLLDSSAHQNDPLNFRSSPQQMWQAYTGNVVDAPSGSYTQINIKYILAGSVYKEITNQLPGTIIATATSGTPITSGAADYFAYLSQIQTKGSPTYYLNVYKTYVNTTPGKTTTPIISSHQFILNNLPTNLSEHSKILISGDGKQLLIANISTDGQSPQLYQADLADNSKISLEVKLVGTPLAPSQNISQWVTLQDYSYAKDTSGRAYYDNQQSTALLGLSNNQVELYRYAPPKTGSTAYQLQQQSYNMPVAFAHVAMLKHVTCTTASRDHADSKLSPKQKRLCFFYGIAQSKTDPAFDVEVLAGLDPSTYSAANNQVLTDVARTPVNGAHTNPVFNGLDSLTLDADSGNMLAETSDGDQVILATPKLIAKSTTTTSQELNYTADTTIAKLPTGHTAHSGSVH